MLEMDLQDLVINYGQSEKKETPRASPKLLAWADIRDRYLNREKEEVWAEKADDKRDVHNSQQWSWKLKICGENVKLVLEIWCGNIAYS